MSGTESNGRRFPVRFVRRDLAGAVGDTVTVLPIVVSIAVLTELSLGLLLIWFGVFQIVWGRHYGVPMSVEPMKALAGLLLAGALTTGEFLAGGLLAGLVLVGIGATNTLGRLRRILGERVIRGIQLAVALLLLDTGVGLASSNPRLAAGAGVLALAIIVAGYQNLSALLVLGVGGVIAASQVGWPALAIPSVTVFEHLSMADVTVGMLGATMGQLAMTIGNAAVATSLLVDDLYDRAVSPDALSTSMGVMNLIAVPLGGVPMCHGSGGVAGKYAFGARTWLSNLALGIAYIIVAVTAVQFVTAYPLSMLGVILVLVGLQLAHTSLAQTEQYVFVSSIGLIGLLTNIGAAFLVGILLHVSLERYHAR